MAKVMLVEDDNNLRDIYQARLAAEGYEIVAAKDGEEALALAVKEKPDLILCDVMMPKVSGFELLDIIRSTAAIKDTKVIMMTALSQAEDRQRADKLGADRYLVKSQVTLEDMAKTVSDVLKGTEASEADLAALTNATPAVATPVAPAEPSQLAQPPAPTPPPSTNIPVSTPPTDTPSAPPPTSDDSAVLPTQISSDGQPVQPVDSSAPIPASEASDPIDLSVPSEVPPTPAPEAAPVTPPIGGSDKKPEDLLASAEAELEKSANANTNLDSKEVLISSHQGESTPDESKDDVAAEKPAEKKEEQDEDDDSVVVAKKKIIQPLNDPNKPKTNIDELLAKEEAKQAASGSYIENPVITSDVNEEDLPNTSPLANHSAPHAPGNVISPEDRAQAINPSSEAF